MPKPIDVRRVLSVLAAKGFVFVSQKGSHAKYRSVSKPARIVIVKTTSKQIPFGTFSSILNQSGLSESDFS